MQGGPSHCPRMLPGVLCSSWFLLVVNREFVIGHFPPRPKLSSLEHRKEPHVTLGPRHGHRRLLSALDRFIEVWREQNLGRHSHRWASFVPGPPGNAGSKSKVALVSAVSCLRPKTACHVEDCLSCKESHCCFMGPRRNLDSV